MTILILFSADFHLPGPYTYSQLKNLGLEILQSNKVTADVQQEKLVVKAEWMGLRRS